MRTESQASLRPDDLVGYVFRANYYCERDLLERLPPILGDYDCSDCSAPANGSPPYCGACWPLHASEDAIEAHLNRRATERGIDREREESFDSDDFPKVLLRDQAHGAECGTCGTDLTTTRAIDWRTASKEGEDAR